MSTTGWALVILLHALMPHSPCPKTPPTLGMEFFIVLGVRYGSKA
ncbi:hypothetical protein [Nostoc sp.]